MEWIELFQSLGFFTIGSAAVAYIVKVIITSSINKELESFKSKVELEAKKGFSLHEERREVIKELYKRIVHFERDMVALTCPLQMGGVTENDRVKAAAQSGNEFIAYYTVNEIYFSQEIMNIVDKIDEKFKKSWRDFESKNHFKEIVGPEHASKFTDYWMESWKAVSEDIPKLKKDLKIKFQELLGVEINTKN